MNFNWDSNTIRWYQDANNYSGFYESIAGLIAPKLKGYSTLCDIGCGLGLVDLELSKNMERITCIDISEEAISALEKSAEEKNLTNIEPILMDCNDITGSWDVIYVSFFGSHDLEEFLPRCKKLIAVVRKKSKSEFFFDKHKSVHKNTSDKLEQELKNKGIHYSLTEVSFEFGQPLVSIEEASNFVRTHSTDVSPQVLASFLAHDLIETGEMQYPFYIPRKKSMGIFEIKGQL